MKKLRIPLLVVILVAAMLLPVSAGEKVTLCHKPDTPAELTLEVGAAASAAHLAHGDYLGECTNASEGCQALNALVLDPQTDENAYSQAAAGAFTAGETIFGSVTLDVAGGWFGSVGTTFAVFDTSSWVAIVQEDTPSGATETISVEYTVPEDGAGDHAIWVDIVGPPFTITDLTFGCTPAP